MRERATCLAALDGVSLVLHEAAIGSVPRSIDDPWTTHSNNVDGFVTLLLAAREAAEADLVIVAADEGSPLASEIAQWLELWQRRSKGLLWVLPILPAAAWAVWTRITLGNPTSGVAEPSPRCNQPSFDTA